MINVTCQVQDRSNPRKADIKVHNHFNYNDCVEIEVNGERQTINGYDMITAIKNAMNVNR